MMTFSRTRAFCRPSQNRNEAERAWGQAEHVSLSVRWKGVGVGGGQFHNVPQSDLLPHFLRPYQVSTEPACSGTDLGPIVLALKELS